jgi:hypothetical protein
VTRCHRRPAGTEAEEDPVQDVGERLEQTILELLSRRAPTSSICPSDAARAVGTDSAGGAEGAGPWRDLMEPARAAAARLVERGEVEVTQGGEVVDVRTARGPVRIRRSAP